MPPGPPLSPEAFAEIIDVSRETLDRLRRYADLLAKWQRAVSLVGRATLADPWRRHFLDSAQLLRFLGPWPDRPLVLLDAGSGAGFPGLVLAILGRDGKGAGDALDVHLVEANLRKAAFLQEVARATATRIRLHRTRIETLEPFPVDVVTARAFAPLPRFLELVSGFLLPPIAARALLLKGRTAEEELTAARKQWTMRVESAPSISDPAGVVLKLENVIRA